METAIASSSTTLSSIDTRVLELLASGIDQKSAAGALGLTEGRITQIISDPVFASLLAEKRFEQLRKHNATDNEYDELEKTLIAQLKRFAAMAMKPMEIARILQIVNSAKRRGASAPESITRQRTTVRLNIPVAVAQRFQVNAANQVVQIESDEGPQDLVTIQSGNMQRLLNESAKTINSGEELARTDANGFVYEKRRGREQNLLAELGFTVEIEIESAART